MKISLKGMLSQSRLLIGMTTQHVTQPWLARLWKQSGCDFIYLEYEHSFFSEGQLADFVLCCRSEGLPVVAKVPECSRTYVAKLLDCGVIGIQLPWTETKEQIDRLVSYVKFPPLGIRAACPGWGNSDYDLDVDGRQFIEEANRETVILAHVETRRGVETLGEILANPQIDIVMVGTYDLSVSVGHPGQFEHPDLSAQIERVIAVGSKYNKVIGIWAASADFARRWFKKGVTFFETASEVDLIGEGARRLVREFRSVTEGVECGSKR